MPRPMIDIIATTNMTSMRLKPLLAFKWSWFWLSLENVKVPS
jgi:hypothetical protein